MKLKIMIMTLLLITGIGSAVNRLPATEFVGDIDFASGYYARNATEGVYNVLDYGADNTGATDASTIIQSVIDAAYDAGGGVVYIPAGTYTLETDQTPAKYYKSLLVAKDNVTVVGAGMGVTTLRLGDNVRDERGAVILYSQETVPLNNFTVMDLTIDYNAPTNQGTTTNSWFSRVGAWYGQDCNFIRLEICNLAGYNGIGFGGSGFTAFESKNILVRDCKIHNIGRVVDENLVDVTAIFAYGTNVIVDGCTIYNDRVYSGGNLGAGVELHGDNNVIQNCIIVNMTAAVLSAYIVAIDGVTDSTQYICNNIFINCMKGVEYWNGAAGEGWTGRCDNLIINNNLIELSQHYAGCMGIQFHQADTALTPNNTVIRGNVITFSPNLSSSYQHIGINWNHAGRKVTIAENIIKGISSSAGSSIPIKVRTLDSGNVTASIPRVIDIINNEIYDMDGIQSIAVLYRSNVDVDVLRVTGNLIQGNASLAHIYILSNADRITISDNDIIGSGAEMFISGLSGSKLYIRHVSPTAPYATTPVNGSQWIDTTNNIEYKYYGGWRAQS